MELTNNMGVKLSEDGVNSQYECKTHRKWSSHLTRSASVKLSGDGVLAVGV